MPEKLKFYDDPGQGGVEDEMYGAGRKALPGPVKYGIIYDRFL